MSWKFKVSKYKNSSPKFPKREESIYDVQVGSVLQSCGNHIAAGCTYMAFNIIPGGGGNVGILPLEAHGRIEQSLPVLKAHSGNVTDMAFSPFQDRLLATCSADNTIKVWSLPEEERLADSIVTLSHSCKLPDQDHRVENVAWNTVADNVLAASVQKCVKIFDVEASAEKYVLDMHGDQIQSLCWHSDGITLVTTCKDKKLRVLDPRSSSVAQEGASHGSSRDSRAVCLQDLIITTGFNASCQRELYLWDGRSLKSPLATQTMESNTGAVMPLLDEDTSMLLLVGKIETGETERLSYQASVQQGDSCWSYFEVATKDPYFTQNSVERTEKSDQIKGACFIPKRAVKVMEGEVDRLLLTVQNSILPLPYIVPRKQYKDFHADLFPDTKSGEAALSAAEWFEGQNGQVSLMSLNPANRSSQSVKTVVRRSDRDGASSKTENTEVKPPPPEAEVSQSQPSPSNAQVSNPQAALKSTGNKKPQEAPAQPEPPREPSKASKTFSALHQSKCKYLTGKTSHPSTHIVNIRKLCRTLPGQSNLFDANPKRCLIPIEGSGGLVAVLELNKPGKMVDTGLPVLQNGSKVNDFAFDPFDDTRVLVGCDNAKVFIWKIPEAGLTETLTDYEAYLMSHTEKIYFVRFHPTAKDVVVTGSYDMTLKIWDLESSTEEIEIACHTDEIFCAEWSPDGRLLATVCKDGKVRIFDPRKSTDPIKEGVGPEGSRGARVIWAVNMKYLVVSGFTRDSVRLLSVYSTDTLGEPLHKENLDTCPAILVPHYDEGTSTIFLTGRGDPSIFTYEVSDEFPHLFPLSPLKPEGDHQGISLLPKTMCDVKKVEIAKLLRLTKTTIESITVTVPRVKTEYFQDDLFPDMYRTDVPTMTSNEWFRGSEKLPEKISLKPKDMKLLSEAPVEAPKARKYDSYSADTYKTDDMKKEELISAVTNKLDVKESPLPQDIAEGVDSDEWDDY